MEAVQQHISNKETGEREKNIKTNIIGINKTNLFIKCHIETGIWKVQSIYRKKSVYFGFETAQYHC